MKVHIHPHYAAYESLIRVIPSGEYEREEVYCNRRNTVEKIRLKDKLFVLKKYNFQGINIQSPARHKLSTNPSPRAHQPE